LVYVEVVMNTLIVKNGSRLEDNIDYEIGPGRLWCQSIKKMDTNIISVTLELDQMDTIIEFNSEEHKNWFLLRWA